MPHSIHDPRRLGAELAGYEHAKHLLLENFPDLDDQTLADTLEGLTDLHEMLGALVRSALDDEALAVALSTRLTDMKARRLRLVQRAVAKRRLVLNAMSHVALKRLVESDFTLSVHAGAAAVQVVDDDAIPDAYWVPQPHRLDRQRLLADLKQGLTIAGAQLSAPAPILTVSVK